MSLDFEPLYAEARKAENTLKDLALALEKVPTVLLDLYTILQPIAEVNDLAKP